MSIPHNFYHYTHLFIMYLDHDHLYLSVANNRYLNYISSQELKSRNTMYFANCTYLVKERERANKLVAWNTDPADGRKNDDKKELIVIGGFLDSLETIQQKPKNNWSKEDKINVEAFVDFLRESIYEKIQREDDLIVTSQCHFVCITPGTWSGYTNHSLLRDIFIRAELINEHDDPSRLLFYTRLQSLVYYIQVCNNKEEEEHGIVSLKKRTTHAICSFERCSRQSISVNFDLFQTNDPLVISSSVLDIHQISSQNFFDANPATSEEAMRHNLKCYLESRILTYFSSCSNKKSIDPKMLQEVELRLQNFVLRAIKSYDIKSNPFADPTATKLIFDFSERIEKEESIEEEKRSNTTSNRNKYQNKKKGEEKSATRIFFEGFVTNISKIQLRDVMDAIITTEAKVFLNSIKELFFQEEVLLRELIFTKMKEALRYNQEMDEESNSFIIPLISIYLREFIIPKTTIQVQGYTENESYFASYTHEIYLSGAFYKAMDEIKLSVSISPPTFLCSDDMSQCLKFNHKFSTQNVMIYIDISFANTFATCTIADNNYTVIKPLDIMEVFRLSKLRSLQQLMAIAKSSLLKATGLLRTKRESGSLLKYLDEFDLGNALYEDDKYEETDEASLDSTIRIYLRNLERLFPYSSPSMILKKYRKIHHTILRYYLDRFGEAISKKLLEYAPKKNTFTNNVTRYTISVEKLLLEGAFGTENDIKEVVFSSKLIESAVDRSNILILTQVEAISSGVCNEQAQTFLPQRLKSHYLQFRIHEDYLQLTLNQVVSLPSDGTGDISSITILDEIFSITDIYEAMFLNFWDNAQSHNELANFISPVTNNCEEHEGRNMQEIVCSLAKYNILRAKLTNHILNLCAVMEKDDLQFSEMVTVTNSLRMTDECNCDFEISNRTLIEIAIMPAIDTIINTFVASFVDTTLFGNYNVDHTFIELKLERSKAHSFLHYLYIAQIEKVLSAESTDEKKNNISYSIIKQHPSLRLQSESLNPTHPQQQGIQFFHKGVAKQVASDTYAIKVCSTYNSTKMERYTYQNISDKKAYHQLDDTCAIVIMAKGLGMRNQELRHSFYNIPVNSFDRIELIRLNNQAAKLGVEVGDRISLSDETHNVIGVFTSRIRNIIENDTPFTVNISRERRKNPLFVSWTIRIILQNYSESLKFTNVFQDNTNDEETTLLGDPLTVSYF